MIEQLQGLTDTHTGITTALKELYSCDCGHVPNLADTSPEDDIMAMLEKMFKSIYQLRGMPATIDKGMVRLIAEKYFAHVSAGFDKMLTSIDYNTPDYTMLRNLQNNCFQFSAAKNYQQLKATSKALVGDDGKLRNWTAFKNEAYKINNEQVTSWLKAEYNLATASGQMAATWTRATENEAVLPLLKFDAIMDGRTSPICTTLNGVIKPLNDSFWDLYYPPNHFGCRSDALSLSSGKITPTLDIVFPDKVPPMFKTNLAKNGLVFPEGHPYYTGLPHQVSEQAVKLAGRG